MKHILVYNNDCCESIYVEDETMYEGIKIKEMKNIILIGNRKLQINQSISFDHRIFVYSDQSTWSYISLKDDFLLGRSIDCDLCIQDESISNCHARIYKDHSYMIEDLNSTNGIYVNGKKEQKVYLNDLDRIYIASYEIIFIHDFLLINMDIPSTFKTVQYESISYPLIPKNDQIFRQDSLDLEIESYISQKDITKQSLFQSIGSSILILFSSAFSCLILRVLYPEQTNQLLSMVLMSGSMSFAFLFYGIYNRESNYKHLLKEKQKNESFYFDYLESLESQIDQYIHDNDQQIETYISNIDQGVFRVSKERIPIQRIAREGVCFHFRKPGYQVAQSHMNAYFMEWLNRNTKQMKDLFYLKQSKYWIVADEQWAYSFFMHLCLIDEKCKVVWVATRVDDRYISNPMSCIQCHRLWIYDFESYYEVQKLCSSYDLIYIVFDSKFLSYLSQTVLYVSLESCSYPFDYVIYDPIHYSNSTNLSNKIMYQQLHQNDRNQESFFTIRWNTYCDLNVCIGLDPNNQPIYLDLSESKDGPHGLVAGSTGSGKSEFLSNILLQCICQNSPEYFQYILIDFKGGAFGNVFCNFPHFAGMITNLDDDCVRFIQYLEQFIISRQESLKQFQLEHPSQKNHIDAYNEWNPQSPLSHVLIVVDEFAQLKTQGYDLLCRIKEMARIGRSLGIHLILSTQKPLGVIDDQIWANSNYQVCLKVQSTQDSKEVIHSDHAYFLKNPGDFILRVDKEVKGKSFYIHSIKEDSQMIEVNHKDEILEEKEKITILESVYREIKDMKQDLIIPNPLSSYSFKNECVIYENVSNKTMDALSINYGEILFILTEVPDLMAMSFCDGEYVYAYRLSSLNDYIDHNYEDKSLFWDCVNVEHNMTILLNIDQDLEFWNPLFNKPNLRIIVFLTHMKSSYQSFIHADRICIQYGNIDTVRMFFNDYTHIHLSKEYGILQRNQSYYLCLLNHKQPMDKKIKQSLKGNAKELIIGKNDKDQMIMFKKDRPLLICFAQRSVEKEIDVMISNWLKNDQSLNIESDFSKKFDICICNVIEKQMKFSSAEYLVNHYDWNILWVGDGLMDYCFLLKRRVPAGSGDIVYWNQIGGMYLQWKEYE